MFEEDALEYNGFDDSILFAKGHFKLIAVEAIEKYKEREDLLELLVWLLFLCDGLHYLGLGGYLYPFLWP